MGRSITILDGGMGRQLKALGAPFRLPEWSALALIEGPDFIRTAHEQFIAAGAEIITTNSYSILPHQIGLARFDTDAERLADLAGRLARAAADGAPRKVLVAGSIPPLFGSYHPERFDAVRAPAILHPLVSGLRPHVDLWLTETQSATWEMAAAATAIGPLDRPLWVSYTLKDELDRFGGKAPAELRSGEPVGAAVSAAVARGAEAILFNCSQPEVMEAAIRDAVAAAVGKRVRIGVYANAFAPEPASGETYAGISGLREDLTPLAYLDWVRRWIDAGAEIIGGCCGIGPEHIAEIHRLEHAGAVASSHQ